MADEIKPFKIHISDEELDLLNKKLALARLPENTADSEWGEKNGVTVEFMRNTIEYWRTSYSWREQEAKINQMPQFTTTITLPGVNKDGKAFDPMIVHFAHIKAPPNASGAAPIPLLFLHGWPGNFAEIERALPLLTAAGFDVVSPSLGGYGWSSLPRQNGMNKYHQADVLHMLMMRLGYDRYVVQGGDWGAMTGRLVVMQHPKHALAGHLNLPICFNIPELKPGDLEKFTPQEQAGIKRRHWFVTLESAYGNLHTTKPRKIGFAMHDSPVGMLAWIADKMNIWSDLANLPGGGYTKDEYITWTLFHYFPGPTTAMQMYRNNLDPETMKASLVGSQIELHAKNYVSNPIGVSVFPFEVAPAPRAWVSLENNVTFWRVHDKGGHFAAYEQPELFSKDVIEFLTAEWKKAHQ